MNSKTFIRGLTRKLYPVCKFDGNENRAQNSEKYAEHKITYGEMEYEGIDKLYAFAKNVRPNIDTFIDIGSGRGKLCMYMAAKPQISRCLGIELVECRHNDAMQLKQQLNSEYADKVEFINSNIFDIDFAKYHFSQERIFIWFSNLCFDQTTTNSIFEKIKQELPVGTVIACSKTLCIDNAQSNEKNDNFSESIDDTVDGFRLLSTVSIPMSWSKDSNVYVYTIV